MVKEEWILEQHSRRMQIPDAKYRLDYSGDSDSDSDSGSSSDDGAGAGARGGKRSVAAATGGGGGGGAARSSALPGQGRPLPQPAGPKPIFLWLAGASGALPANNNPMKLLEHVGEGVGPLPGLSGMAGCYDSGMITMQNAVNAACAQYPSR